MGDSFMFNSLSACWQALKTKFKKTIPFILTFILFLSPLSVSAAEVSPDADNLWFLLPFDRFANGYADGEFNSSSGTYYADSSSVTTDWPVLTVSHEFGGVFPSFSSGKDYLVYFTFVSATPSSFNVNRFVFRENVNELSSSFELNIISRTSRYVNDTCTVTALCSFSPSSTFTLSTASAVFFNISPSSTISGRTSWAVYALDVTESTADEVNQIVSAINNQTDFIVNGNSSTGGIVSGADSSRSELETIVNDYQQIENNMLDNFTLYQSDILTDLNGWSWGGLSTCANWVGDTMTSYFQNMGDFKQYIIYPLLLGIALFFIGRGSSIIGHLYRKPTVTTTISNRESVTYKQNGTKYTDSKTTTYRDGGVLRK